MTMQQQDPLFRQSALERLSSPEQLDQLLQVTTSRGWLALVGVIALLAVGVVVAVGSVIPIRTQAVYCVLAKDPDTQEVSAIFYFHQSSGKNRVVEGDEATISPSLTDHSGFLLGKVQSVGDFPATEDEMINVLGNQTLVYQLEDENGSLTEARVNLIPAGDNLYQWSSGEPADVTVREKAPCEGSITIDRRTPIQLILQNPG